MMSFQTKEMRVAQILRDAILSKEVNAGDWIRIEEWATRLEISPTPIREALRRLEAEGLVQVFPHRGAQVTAYARTDFEDVYRMRATLEGLATRLAVERLGAEDRRVLCTELRRLQAALYEAAEAGRLRQWRDGNIAFHAAIRDAARAPRLTITIDHLRLTYTLSLQRDQLGAATLQHDTIVDAIERGDAESAEAASRDHVVCTAVQLLDGAPAEPAIPPA